MREEIMRCQSIIFLLAVCLCMSCATKKKRTPSETADLIE